MSQTAHSTQARYEVSALTAEQSQLRLRDAEVTDQLERMRSAARIDAAAQQLGMRPAAQWSYVAAAPEPIALPAAPKTASAPAGTTDPVQRLLAALGDPFVARPVSAAAR